MKKGCLILIAIIAICFYFYYQLLNGTSLSGMWWIPFLLGICAAIIFANIQGIFMALGHIAKAKKNQTQWKDGEIVVLSGRIQALRNAINAPISGKASTIVEYQVSKTERVSKNQSSTVAYYRGCLMTPCSVHSPSGQVNIVGFPILTQLGEDRYYDDESYKRIAQFLTTTPTTLMPISPLAAISELNKVLKDEDGDVFSNYRREGVPDLKNPTEIPEASEISIGTDDEISHLDPEEQAEVREINKYANSSDPVEKVIHYFKGNGFDLKETIVPNGAEVTIMGTYNASRRQVNIGSGLSNLSHSIYIGPASKVLSNNLRKCIIFLVIFSAIFLVSNYFLLKEIGIDPNSAIKQLTT